MMFNFKKYIYFKLVFSFFCVIFISMILSFFITSKIHYDDIKSHLQSDLDTSIENIYKLYKSSEYDIIDNFMNMTFYPITGVAIYDKSGLLFESSKKDRELKVPNSLVEEVLNNKKDLNPDTSLNFFFPTDTPSGFYIKDSNKSYALFINVSNIKDVVKVNKWLFLNIFFVLSSGLIGYMIIAKSIVKPIKTLTSGTKSVSSGDYEFQIPNKRNDEIGELTNTFNYMLVELNKTDKMRNEFVSNVSHEIKTPITAIRGFSDLLTYKNISDEERIYYANVIKEEVLKVTSLSDNLLKLASLDNSKANIDKTSFKLDELIRRAILDLEAFWSSKNLEFDLDLKDTVMLGDNKLLYHVFTNLIRNSIKFSNDNSIIKLSLTNDEKYIYFEITDNGTGISKESIPRIFERFYKGDESRNSEGTGLGLSIVKKIVSLHKGTITVDSIENIKTTFYITFPK